MDVILRMPGGPDVRFDEVVGIDRSYVPWQHEYDVLKDFKPIFTQRAAAGIRGEATIAVKGSALPSVQPQSGARVIDLGEVANLVNQTAAAGTPSNREKPHRRVCVTFASDRGAYYSCMPEAWANEFFGHLATEIRSAISECGLQLSELLRAEIACSPGHPLLPLIEQDFQ